MVLSVKEEMQLSLQQKLKKEVEINIFRKNSFNLTSK